MSQTDTLLTVPSGQTDRAFTRPLASLDRSAGREGRPANATSGRTGSAGADIGRPGRDPAEAPASPRSAHRGLCHAGSGAFLSACTVGWSGGPARVLACSIAEATAPDPAL